MNRNGASERAKHDQGRVEGRPRLSARVKLVFAIVTVVLCLGVLELAARLVVPPPGADLHAKHRKLISFLGFPEANQCMEHDPRLFW